MQNVIENIYEINLALKANEKVIILTDNYGPETEKIAKLVAETGKKYTSGIKYLEFRPTGCHGTEPPEEIWREVFGIDVCNKLRQKGLMQRLISKKISESQLKEAEAVVREKSDEAVDVVIALPYYSTSHTRFRDFLNRLCNVRYASMPLFDKEMLTGPMMVDWEKMLRRSETIAKKIDDCEKIRVESPNGTEVVLSKKGRDVHMDTGIITKAGAFSNLPAGEVYFAPVEGSAEGRLVLEWAPMRKLGQRVTLYIKKGRVTEIEGNEGYVEYLRGKLSEKKENSNIAELGIGTNDKATRPDNILETEKIFGTLHIALGDNSSFGGSVSTPFHQDFVVFKPTLTMIYKKGFSKELFKKGVLVK